MDHIVIVTTSYPDKILGSEAAGSFVEDIALELSKHVFVTVVAPSQADSLQQYGNLSVKRFKVPKLPLSLLKVSNPIHWIAICKTLHKGQKALDDVIKGQSVNHVLALWVLPSGYWAFRLKQKHNIPYSTWSLGSDIWSLGKIPIIRSILRKVLINAQCNFADGHILAGETRGISKRSCTFLPSTRYLPIIKKKELNTHPPYRLSFLGRWHVNKGIDLLLESLHKLSDADWKNISVIKICGGGPLEELVKSEVKKLSLAGHPVEVCGYLDKNAASKLLYETDYLLLPSRIESIPVVFSDAMQASCPVIATPVGDLPRIFSEFSVGCLSEELSSTSYSLAISRALTVAPVMYKDDIEKARLAFSIQDVVNKLLSLDEL